MDKVPHEEEPSDGVGQKGYTSDFVAPLTIKEEVVELYFDDLTKSTVECKKQGCVISVLFNDSNALQKALSISSHKIDDGCFLTPLSRATTWLSPVATVGNPTEDSVTLSAEQQFGGIESVAWKTTLVCTMNVDCGVHISKYCLKDLSSYLNIAQCVISSTVVPGDLLLKYDASVSQLDTNQVRVKIYEYAKKFTTFVVAIPEHDEKNLEHLLHSGCALVSCCLLGRFPGCQLYKICCETTYISEVQQRLSGAITVPLIDCIPGADSICKADQKCQGIVASAEGIADVKSEPSSSTNAENLTDLARSDRVAPTLTETNSISTLGVQPHDSSVASATAAAAAATAAQITSHSDRMAPKGHDSLLTTGSSKSAIYSPAVELEPKTKPAVTSSTVSTAVLSAALYNQATATPSVLNASADRNVQHTPEAIDSVRRTVFPKDHLHATPDSISVTVSADSQLVQLFKKDLEWRFFKDLEQLIPVKDPECRVRLFYDDQGFLLYGNHDGVHKAKELLQLYFKRVAVKERQLDTTPRDDYSSSRWIGDADSVSVASKLNDALAPDNFAANFGSGGLVAAPRDVEAARQVPKEQFKENLPRKSGEQAKEVVAANREQGYPDEASRHKSLQEKKSKAFVSEVFNVLGGNTGASSASNSLVLELSKGSVADQKADVLINSVDPLLDLSGGRISSSMLEKAGIGLQHELQQRYPNGIQEFNFAVTSGYKLNCQVVLHVACGRYKGRHSEKDFAAVIFDCLRYADSLGMKSIVFPAIGAGVLRYPPETVIELLHSAVSSFSATVPKRNLQSVRCVVYDQQTYDAFESALARLLRDNRGGSEDFGVTAGLRAPNAGTKQRQEMARENQVDEKYVHHLRSESSYLLRPTGGATRQVMERDNQQYRMTESQRYSSASDHTSYLSASNSSGSDARYGLPASAAVELPYSGATDRSYSQALSAGTRSQPRTQSSSSSGSTSERTHKKY